MGQALLNGWLDRGVDPSTLSVIEPEVAIRDRVAARHPDIRALESAAALDPDVQPGVVVLAVKPQVMDPVVGSYRRLVRPESVFLSIAAGRTIASFQRLLGEAARVVRAMPNTPAAVHRGITVACAGPGVSSEQRRACTRLLEAVGSVVWTDDESLMDAVTAVSGSGPAYVFLLAETLAEAGVAAGLPAELAARLARETVTGAAALLAAEGASPAALRRGVMSPGGTTEAALRVLMAEPDGLAALMREAVDAAKERSRALAS
ncbi:MAG: pyrroline-5-carboxylate reductase [Rhodospirillales bacterium]|nr:MAG: pyrroline-5-carboxylate reductase [Rhodospirillales bacterium]